MSQEAKLQRTRNCMMEFLDAQFYSRDTMQRWKVYVISSHQTFLLSSYSCSSTYWEAQSLSFMCVVGFYSAEEQLGQLKWMTELHYSLVSFSSVNCQIKVRPHNSHIKWFDCEIDLQFKLLHQLLCPNCILIWRSIWEFELCKFQPEVSARSRSCVNQIFFSLWCTDVDELMNQMMWT